MIIRLLCISAVLFLGACASAPSVTTVQELSESADAPYDNVLVVSLFESFDLRRIMEEGIVKNLEARGVRAVPSTSHMNTRVPVTRQTLLSLVEKLDSDAVLVTQLVDLDASAKVKDMNPQATLNIRPTYYYNVWSVEQTEYVEPQGVEITNNIVLATQLYSVRDKEPVWAIESKSKVFQAFDRLGDISPIYDEARAIVSHLSRDGALAR